MPAVPTTPNPEPHSPPTPPEGSQPPAPAAHGRPRLRKILTPLVLSALGVLLGLVAYFVVYPSPETGIPAPSYSRISIDTSVPISSMGVSIDQVTDSVGRITVSLLLPPGVSIPPASAKNDITVELPTGADFYNCEECVNVPPVDYIYGVTSFVMEKLIFTKYSIPGFFSGSARVSLELTPSNVAMNFDGINAYAAIPEVTLTGQARGALLLAAFHIPSASSYDWSSSPPENVESSEVDWNEFLKTGDTAGRTTVGINHARMANDATLNFLAGALIGLAAAAILSAVQEALHVFTDTSTTTRPAPNDE